MTQQAAAVRTGRVRELFRPTGRPPGASDPSARPWWLPQWSVPAAMRALRATLVVPTMLALTLKVFDNEQMAVFAVFGSFGALVMTTFGGSRRDKAVAHLGLAVAGSISLIVGTLVSGSAPVAALATVPFAFVVYFSGVAGPNAAAGVTATLLAYVLPAASSAGVAAIPSRLAGWWLAQAVSTAAVLVLSPQSPGDRLRRSTAALAAALAHYLQAAVGGTATEADRQVTLAAKTDLMTLFRATPYRPIGLAAADQALASLISLLEWSTSLTCETADSQLEISQAAESDRQLLTESAAALRVVAGLLETGSADRAGGESSLKRVWQARKVSAAHLRGLSGDPAEVRRLADQAFHAQAIGIAAAAAAADALIAKDRRDAEWVDSLRRRWIAAHLEQPDRFDAEGRPVRARRRAHPLLPPASGTIAADANIRSIWFRNSARGACALAAAVAVARVIGVQHAFWVVLGTLSVLRSSAGATGSTALRALAGTVVGFAIGGALLVGIGASAPALWVALPVAVLVAAYAPGTAPFLVGQAAFTVTVVVLFNLIVPAGWKVGLVRVEDVAIGCAVSVVVGALFWPRGASALVGDNLAAALRAGAAHLTEATAWALGQPNRHPDQAAAVVAAGIRLDDAMRGYLTEQGSKRLAKQDLWALGMSAVRLRLTAYSLASLPGLEASRGPAAEHPIGPLTRSALLREADQLAGFYDGVAAEVGRPSHAAGARPDVQLPAAVSAEPMPPCTIGPAHYHPEALWVSDHLRHLGAHSAELVGPAGRLAELRRRPWWR